MNEVIDISLYNLADKSEECYEFSLKLDIFNNNIHELIKEISPLTYPNTNYFAYFLHKKMLIN